MVNVPLNREGIAQKNKLHFESLGWAYSEYIVRGATRSNYTAEGFFWEFISNLSGIKFVFKRHTESWKEILQDDGIMLPAPFIMLYNEDGNLTTTWSYPRQPSLELSSTESHFESCSKNSQEPLQPQINYIKNQLLCLVSKCPVQHQSPQT